jgi:dihydroflavonol-4-reductase
MRAFVTGATGFAGANLVRALLEESHQCEPALGRASDRANIRNLAIESVDGDE